MKSVSGSTHTLPSTLLSVLISGLISTLLSACGQTGPLFMPVRPTLITPVAATTPPVPAPAPAAVAPATESDPVAPTAPVRLKPNQP